MKKLTISVFLTLIFFFMAGHSQPAHAEGLFPLSSTSSYAENLIQASSYAKVICTKDKDVCIKTLKEVSSKENETQNTPQFSIKIVPSNTYIIPQPHPEEPKVTLSADTLFDMVNDYRIRFGLIKFEKEDNLCSLATNRASELPQEFSSRTLHRGLYKRSFPYYISENAIYAHSEDFAINWWLKSSIHRGQLLGDYKYSCLRCNGRACSQLFTNFTPKYQEPTAFADN